MIKSRRRREAEEVLVADAEEACADSQVPPQKWEFSERPRDPIFPKLISRIRNEWPAIVQGGGLYLIVCNHN